MIHVGRGKVRHKPGHTARTVPRHPKKNTQGKYGLQRSLGESRDGEAPFQVSEGSNSGSLRRRILGFGRSLRTGQENSGRVDLLDKGIKEVQLPGYGTFGY